MSDMTPQTLTTESMHQLQDYELLMFIWRRALLCESLMPRTHSCADQQPPAVPSFFKVPPQMPRSISTIPPSFVSCCVLDEAQRATALSRLAKWMEKSWEWRSQVISGTSSQQFDREFEEWKKQYWTILRPSTLQCQIDSALKIEWLPTAAQIIAETPVQTQTPQTVPPQNI